jgi:hypothetical protein
MTTAHDLTHRRRIVAHGLRGLLPDATVRRAARLCDDEFGRDPSFSVVKFLGLLSATDAAAAAARAALFASLQRARLLPPDQLAPDPLGDAPAGLAATPPPAPLPRPVAAGGGAGWYGVFNALLDGLTTALARIDPALPGRARAHLGAAVGGLGLAAPAAREAAAWVTTGQPAFGPPVTRREMHQVAHALYTWACEEFGPVATDRLFAAAVKSAEAHPAAGTCPPQALL